MILFENEHFIVVDKPAGMLSIPSRTGALDPRPCLLTELSQKQRLWPVHRLDFEVGGVLLFAKSADGHRIANGWFEHHAIRKVYEALTEMGDASPPAGEVTWTSNLWRGKRRVVEKPFGKKAVTGARFLQKCAGPGVELGLWELKPLTGRPHQLRYELSRHGFPIWGDTLYGAVNPPPISIAIGLRAVQLQFPKSPETSRLGLPEQINATGVLSVFNIND